MLPGYGRLPRCHRRRPDCRRASGPGRIQTERIEQLDSIRATKTGVSVEQIRTDTAKTIPLGRYGRPDEYAKLAVFLASPANTYITGQTMLVDGGMVKAY